MKLKELLEVHNFRDTYESNGDTIQGTTLLRIHVDRTNWFDFGMYDYSQNKVESFIKPSVLNARVIEHKTISEGEYKTFCIFVDMSEEDSPTTEFATICFDKEAYR